MKATVFLLFCSFILSLPSVTFCTLYVPSTNETFDNSDLVPTTENYTFTGILKFLPITSKCTLEEEVILNSTYIPVFIFDDIYLYCYTPGTFSRYLAKIWTKDPPKIAILPKSYENDEYVPYVQRSTIFTLIASTSDDTSIYDRLLELAQSEDPVVVTVTDSTHPFSIYFQTPGFKAYWGVTTIFWFILFFWALLEIVLTIRKTRRCINHGLAVFYGIEISMFCQIILWTVDLTGANCYLSTGVWYIFYHISFLAAYVCYDFLIMKWIEFSRGLKRQTFSSRFLIILTRVAVVIKIIVAFFLILVSFSVVPFVLYYIGWAIYITVLLFEAIVNIYYGRKLVKLLQDGSTAARFSFLIIGVSVTLIAITIETAIWLIFNDTLNTSVPAVYYGVDSFNNFFFIFFLAIILGTLSNSRITRLSSNSSKDKSEKGSDRHSRSLEHSSHDQYGNFTVV